MTYVVVCAVWCVITWALLMLGIHAPEQFPVTQDPYEIVAASILWPMLLVTLVFATIIALVAHTIMRIDYKLRTLS